MVVSSPWVWSCGLSMRYTDEALGIMIYDCIWMFESNWPMTKNGHAGGAINISETTGSY